MQGVYCPTVNCLLSKVRQYPSLSTSVSSTLVLSTQFIVWVDVVLNCLCEEQQLHLWFLNDDILLFVQIWLWTEVSFGTVPFLSIAMSQPNYLFLSGSRLECVRKCVSLTKVLIMTVHACDSSYSCDKQLSDFSLIKNRGVWHSYIYYYYSHF